MDLLKAGGKDVEIKGEKEMTKIEQVKKILPIIKARSKGFDNQQSEQRTAELIVDALYHLEQVICPNSPQPPIQHASNCQGFNGLLPCNCGAIPIPSVPATVPLPPDELTEEIAELLYDNSYKTLELPSWDEFEDDGSHKKLSQIKRACRVNAKYILSKCRQSEAAEIANKEIEIRESISTITALESKIKELEDKLLTKTLGVECYAEYYKKLYDSKITEARADQNKKIGEIVRLLRKNDTFSIFLTGYDRAIKDVQLGIAKLQKGDFSE